MKHKTAKRIGIIGLAGILAAGTAGATAYAKAPGSTKQEKEITAEAEEIRERVRETAEKVWQPKDGEEVPFRDETVYVVTAADGTTQKVIVSERIREESGEETISQSSTEKELPVSVWVTYSLDGAEMQPEELVGKSGHIVIRYTYENRQYENREIGGKTEEIHVPYLVLTGMVLDNDHFGNVTVSSGKVIHDGSRSLVAGIAFPGLNGDLGAEQELLPEYIEVEADTEDFSLGSVYTIVTNEVFSSLNLEEVDLAEEVKDAVSELTDAVEALAEGSSELYDGMAELADRTGDLKSGVGELTQGAGELSEGAAALCGGIQSLQSGAESLQSGAQSLQSGAATLSSGLNTLSSKNGELTQGAAQVFHSLLAAANQQLAASGISVTLTIENYAATLNGMIQSAEQQVYNSVYDSVKASVLAQVLANAGLDQSAYNALPEGDSAKAAIDQTVADTMETADVQSQISTLVAQNTSGATAQLADLKSQLDSYQAFYQGLLSYTAGVSSASSGAGQLSSGAGQLSSGASALSSGAQELAAGAAEISDGSVRLKDGLDTLGEGTDALAEGAALLKDGAEQLKDGLAIFDREGLQKLSDLAGADLDTLTERLEAISRVSRDYSSFAGDSEDIAGSVKFIIRTAEIR